MDDYESFKESGIFADKDDDLSSYKRKADAQTYRFSGAKAQMRIL